MGETLTNIERFPNNIFVPDRVNIKGNEYIRYRAYFRGLDDVQKYLMSNPTVNEKAFPKRASKSLNIFSYGLPYFWVVRNLNKEPRGTYKKFLELSDTLDYEEIFAPVTTKIVKSPTGSIIDMPSLLSGTPYYYNSYIQTGTIKTKRLNVQLVYNYTTTKKQLLNRALIILALIHALERANYNVDLNVFDLSLYNSEIIDINIALKDGNEPVNLATLYKTIYNYDFERRIIFSAEETLDVEQAWYKNYGRPCSEEEVAVIYCMDENDIFMDEPIKLGITGKNLIEDFRSAIKVMHLDEYIIADDLEAIGNISERTNRLVL